MPEDKATTTARKIGGRPRVPAGARLVPVTIRLAPAEYDRLCCKALDLQISLPAVVRQELRRARP